MDGIALSGQNMTVNVNCSCNDDLEHEVTEADLTPHVGMEFETEEHAHRYYNIHAGFIGFNVKKEWVNKSKVNNKIVLSRKY